MRTLQVTEQDRLEITRLEEAMWRGETRFDRMFLETRFAPDFFEFGRSGRVYSRKEIFLSEAGEIQVKLWLENLSIRLLDENTAHATYNSQLEYNGVVEHAEKKCKSQLYFY